MRKLLPLFIGFILFVFSTGKALAIYDPVSVPNNRYGIHLHDENDLQDAAQLVNSSGGDWGYVTMVIRKDDRDINKWQNTFNKLRKLHLIPIVRIATSMKDEAWEKPAMEDIDNWIYFLNSLNWVISNRYVSVGNEPNHAKEWGGQVNPEEYAVYLNEFSKKMKNSSDEFFIIPAGFDASAPNSKETMEEGVYLEKMLIKVPDLFDNIDGWASHSYPNPGFAGPENGNGKGSIRTFEWELSHLKLLGVNKNLPVFITETGWIHSGENVNSRKVAAPESLSQKYEKAFLDSWNDGRVVAVTPFIINYQDPPFDSFSWQRKDGSFYDFYYRLQQLPKQRGQPVQNDKGRIVTAIFPPFSKSEETVTGILLISNIGQSIWEPGEIRLKDAYGKHYIVNTGTVMEPGITLWVPVKVDSGSQEGMNQLAISLERNNRQISDSYYLKILTLKFTDIWEYIAEVKNSIVERINRNRVYPNVKVHN